MKGILIKMENLMPNRISLPVLLCVPLVLSIASCGGSPSIPLGPANLTSIVISPASVTTTLGSGTAQANYTATGYYTITTGTTKTEDITNAVIWSSYTPELVTVSSSGEASATGQATGSTQVVASAPGVGGIITSNASNFTVNPSTDTNGSPLVQSIALDELWEVGTPVGSPVGPGQTAYFNAVGTTGTGAQEFVAPLCTWTSTNLNVATIIPTGRNGGTVTATGAGTTGICATFGQGTGTFLTGCTILTVQ